MCGIGGVVARNNNILDHALIEQIATTLQHRGPDGYGFAGYSNDGILITDNSRELVNCHVLFAHRRLSIIDLSPAGKQPMLSRDQTSIITFNGEIYNYLEIKLELEAAGLQFASQSDTEVLLEAYNFWGRENITVFLNRLVGMFAFAILDTNKRSLLLARDFFGIKPLYYLHSDRYFAFASEIKALLPLLSGRPHANLTRIYDYLSCGLTDHGEETTFREIKQIPSASFMEISLKDFSVKLHRYWQISLEHKLDISYQEASNQLRDLFLKSITLHLRSDVPVGSCLSGGIDSSSIVSTMRYLDPNLNIHTFSYIADEASVCEEKWVDIVVNKNRTIAHKVHALSGDLVPDLEDLFLAQDEPFGSTSIYAQYRVFQLIKQQGIKVVLDGQGADELLGGYRSLLIARLKSLVKQGKWLKAILFAWRISLLTRENLFYQVIKRFLPSKIKKLLKLNTSSSGINQSWFSTQDINPTPLGIDCNSEMLRATLLQTLTMTSVPMLLRYEDRNSMHFSVESRVPFLTPQLAEFMLSLPEEYIISDRAVTKSVFRSAMTGITPSAILDRRDKIGFATPELTWLKSLKSWVEATLYSETAQQIPVLHLSSIHRDWQNIVIGKSPFDFRVWRWLNLIKWVERFNILF
ncbi:MAG: asparagine synthase (glutamine-hydrolyzing) [Pseudanabaenaceae cyanobacterium]